jgi:hypothetical protein
MKTTRPESPGESFEPLGGMSPLPPIEGPCWPVVLVARVVVGSCDSLVRTPIRLKGWESRWIRPVSDAPGTFVHG